MSEGIRVSEIKRAPSLTPIDQSPWKVMWITQAVEWSEVAPADMAPIPPHLLDGIHRFDPEAYPLFVRRVWRTPDFKTVIRVNHALAYQKWTPSSEKEPIKVLRGTYPGPLRHFNGPLYEDRVLEWFPASFTRRDRPGVFQPWDEIRLTEMRHQYWQMYGRSQGVEKTEKFLQSLVHDKAQAERRLQQMGRDRLDDAAGPFNSPYVGYTGKEFQGVRGGLRCRE